MFDFLIEAIGGHPVPTSVDPKSVFCFVGDFNCHHWEWLGSRITDAHGVAAFDFDTVAHSSQLVMDPLISLVGV